MGQGIKWISTTCFKLLTGLYLLNQRPDIPDNYACCGNRKIMLCYFKPDTGPRGGVSTEHGLCYACVVILGQNCETAAYLSCQPAPASPMSRPQPPAQLYMHIILFFTIKYLISRLPPNWSPRLVCLLGSLMKWRESECNDNCAQNPQHSYAARAVLIC